MLRRAVTDDIRQITYDPVGRPEVANLIQMATGLTGEDPVRFAASVGSGAGRLKAAVTEVINERLAPLRQRREELLADPGYLDGVITSGSARTRDIAAQTLGQVRSAMQMDYYQDV